MEHEVKASWATADIGKRRRRGIKDVGAWLAQGLLAADGVCSDRILYLDEPTDHID